MKAFPCNQTIWDEKTGYFKQVNGGGMDLRDYFAAKVIGGIISAGDSYNINLMAEYAYQMADEMMKARKK